VDKAQRDLKTGLKRLAQARARSMQAREKARRTGNAADKRLSLKARARSGEINRQVEALREVSRQAKAALRKTRAQEDLVTRRARIALKLEQQEQAIRENFEQRLDKHVLRVRIKKERELAVLMRKKLKKAARASAVKMNLLEKKFREHLK